MLHSLHIKEDDCSLPHANARCLHPSIDAFKMSIEEVTSLSERLDPLKACMQSRQYSHLTFTGNSC